MEFRLGNISDLKEIDIMYKKIVENMYKNNIQIWNEFYPFQCFKEDIKNKKMYILKKNNEIVSSYTLSDSNDGENCVNWKEKDKKALYLERLGVNVNYTRQGIGSIMIKKAIQLTKEQNIDYLRLFVRDINIPAINLYLKNGFRKVDGIYKEKIRDDYILNEIGYEIETKIM